MRFTIHAPDAKTAVEEINELIQSGYAEDENEFEVFIDHA